MLQYTRIVTDHERTFNKRADNKFQNYFQKLRVVERKNVPRVTHVVHGLKD